MSGDAIPFEVRQIGEAFNTVLAYRNRLLPITYDNYMIVRERLDFLKSWIDDRLADIERGKTKNPEKTIAWYWLKNAGDGSHFAKKDIVFECFHNFVALSQWGNSIFGIMSRLSEDGGDPAVRASFRKTMSGNFDNANGATSLATGIVRHGIIPRYSPNGGSISAIQDARTTAYGASPQQRFAFPMERHSYISTPHTNTNGTQFTGRTRMPSIHQGILAFLPAPKLLKINASRSASRAAHLRSQISRSRMGRKANITNSGFGTVFVLSTGRAFRFVTMRASHHSASDTDGVQASS